LHSEARFRNVFIHSALLRLHSGHLLLHSERNPPLRSLLIIAPTGIYAGRVKKGIDLVIGRETEVEETKVRVILVAGENWIQSEPYKAKFVDKLKDYVLATWKEKGKLDITCDCTVLPVDREEYLTGWLLKQLSDFFESSPREAEVFVDLTSAPKEWQLAAMNVVNFFPRVEAYYVKPSYERQPKDYDQEEIDDEGHPKLETVRTGEPRQPLPHWIEPMDRGEPNLQFLLFKAIFRLAKSMAAEKKLDLDKVLVPIEEERGLEEYKSVLPEKLRKDQKFVDYSRLRKSISKYLTSVEPFRLFEVKAKSVRMTLRAVMLGQALFKDP